MTGSMYASVAGLKAHMQKLTVIGNNVANVNTQGYKKQRTVFRDSVYSMYSAGSNGSRSVGGMNPSQLGYGSMVGSIDLNMSSSSYNPGNRMDCALVGDGFFLVGTKDTANSTNPEDYTDFSAENLKSLNLTRVGDFKIGPDNYLVDSKGNVVYGFMSTSEVEEYVGADGKPAKRQKVSDQLVPIRLPRWEKKVETVNGEEKVSYIIHYARTDIGPDGKPVEDAAGKPANKLVDDKPIYNTEDGGNQGGNQGDADATATDAEYEFAQLSSISIDSKTGCISGISKADDKPIVIGYLAIGSVANPNGVTHIGNSYYKCQEGAGALSVSMLGGVQKDLGISQVNGSMAPAGGANPNDPAADTPEYAPGTDVVGTGATEMMVGFLEAPNVDLAEEIAELITTQRGYQANTRIITVTDSMLEELVNMKR